MRDFDIVVAADRQLGIARDGDLPWHLPGDLKHFKQTTTQTNDPGRRNAVIMGRKTWASIPDKYRPLDGRVNVVLSRRGDMNLPEGVIGCASLEAALGRLDEGSLRDEIERVFVVGGGEIYRIAAAMKACRRIVITRIDGEFSCDTHFPSFEEQYECEAVIGHGDHDGVSYRIEVWRHP